MYVVAFAFYDESEDTYLRFIRGGVPILCNLISSCWRGTLDEAIQWCRVMNPASDGFYYPRLLEEC